MFEREKYRNVRKPLLEAETLPSHCYTDGNFFAREMDTCFRPAWHLVGRVDELPVEGGCLVADTPSGSVLITKDTDGKTHGFVNACRHRGARLRDQGGDCRAIVCPYHAWTYQLDGTLRAAPEMDQVSNFDLRDNSLQPIRLAHWAGFMFVCHDPETPDLEIWLGSMPDFTRDHQLGNLRCVRRFEYTVKSNWKFLIENSLEAYHTGSVHRDSLGAQQSESEITEGQWDALYVLGDERKSIATLPGQKQVMPYIPGLSKKARAGTWFSVIYPSTQIVFSPDSVWWLDFKPISVGQTQLTVGVCFPESSIALAEFDQLAAPYFERILAAVPEDNAIAEGQQQGHQSGLSLPGRFSPREHCVHRLANWVLDRVLA